MPTHYWWVNRKKEIKKPNMSNEVVIKDHGFKATDSAQNKASRNNCWNFFPDLNLLKDSSFRQMAKKKKILNVQHGYYLSPEAPWQPQKLAHPMTPAQGLTLTENIHLMHSSWWRSQGQEANFALVGINLSIPHFWMEGQLDFWMGETTLGGTQKHPLPLIFSSQI